MSRFVLAPPNCPTRTGRRAGSLLFSLMIGVLLVLGILSLSLSSSMGEKTQFIYAHSHSLLLDMAAMEVENQVFAAIGEELRNPQSGLFLKILKARPEDAPLQVSPVWSTAFSFQGKPDLPAISCSIQAQVTDLSPLETGNWKDPWEKFFSLSVQAELSLHIGTLRRSRKRYTFVRPGKVHALVLPAIAKFTLFVKNPEPTDAKNPGYNCFRHTIDGKALTPNDVNKGVEAPLVLCHSTENKQTDLARTGYVFLGGENNIELHLANGADPNYGEIFQFFSLAKPENRSPLFDLTFMPDAFQKPVSLASGTVMGRPGIQQTFFGFYDQDNCSPPNSMNIEGALGFFFDRDQPRTMDSSSLHLFGTMGNPSPTLVVGNVYRVFAAFSGVTLDTDGDGRPDGLLSLLKQPVQLQSMNKADDLWNLVALPAFFKPRKSPGSYEIDSGVSMKTLFGTPAAYMLYASSLVFEPVNRVYEYLTNQKGEFPPEGKFKDHQFPGESGRVPYLFPGEAFEIGIPQAESRFTMNLNSLTGDDLLRHRIDEVVADQHEFLERYVKGTDLDLQGKSVFIREGSLELPPNLENKNPGIIVVAKDIHIKGKIHRAEAKHVLTLVSREGNILLEGTNEEIQAYLVALNGAVYPPRKNHSTIRGGLAVNRFEPGKWKGGGNLNYDSAFDITRPGCEYLYSFTLADYNSEWNVEMEK